MVGDIGDQANDLKPAISKAIDEVEDILKGTEVIESGTDTLIQMLDNISLKWDGFVIEEPYSSPITGYLRNIEFPCDFCTTIAVECASSSVEIQEQTADIFSDLQETKLSVNDELMSQNETIMEAIDSFVTEIEDVERELLDLADTVNDGRDAVEQGTSCSLTTF